MLLPSETQGRVNFTGFRVCAKTSRGEDTLAATPATPMPAARSMLRRVIGRSRFINMLSGSAIGRRAGRWSARRKHATPPAEPVLARTLQRALQEGRDDGGAVSGRRSLCRVRASGDGVSQLLVPRHGRL